jgi:NAD(P)-dependent dehydrogenase (short-subunit alcohol dehydrogenase family)
MEVVVADCSKEQDVLRALEVAKRDPARPLVGVWHVAGVTHNTLCEDVTGRDLERVGGPKAAGAWWLHTHTLGCPLETFVAVSSGSSLVGGRGMSAYSASNGFLDALVRLRRSEGLPGMAFNMASLSDVGMLVQDMRVRQMQMRMGMPFVQAGRALQDLLDALAAGMVQGRHM